MKENNNEILELIQSYFSQGLSEDEFNLLKLWINDKPENKKLFSEYLLLHKKTRRFFFVENIDTVSAWNKIESRIYKSVKKSNFIPKISAPIFKYAAILIACFGITYFFLNQNKSSLENKNHLIIAQEDIRLELENGNVKIINSDGNEKLINNAGNVVAEQSGNLINYKNKVDHNTLEYNKLIIPKGKNFQIVLSDGTKVYLNSGTTFKYPVKFIAGNNRQVYLLEGEAYFDVTEDSAHPFIVNSSKVNVRVLGTEFNISSYPEDHSINTVLVEGSVSIFDKETAYNNATAAKLKPGFKASWNKKDNNLAIDKVDTSIYTSWKNGKLIFRNTQFKNIIKKLERHYNVVITNNNTKLNEQYFDATFDVETIEQVLNSFNRSFKIQYKIENNQIYIN